MANDEHIAKLKKGVAAWNKWREENPNVEPDLKEADLKEADLIGAHLKWANLTGADLSGARLKEADLFYATLKQADLSGADLQQADLTRANLSEANLSGADLSRARLNVAYLFQANLMRACLRRATSFRANLGFADLREADLRDAQLSEANFGYAKLRKAHLSQAYLEGADLGVSDLSEAHLNGAHLEGANLSRAKLIEADLRGADLQRCNLVETDLTGADLTGCGIYGVSAWSLKLDRAKQQNLVITRSAYYGGGEPEITVDNIEVAQFIYLMLHNEKIRDVIDTITSKAVLILGRFTDERKAVLDALRDELRKRDYLPVLFDFAVPATRDITETVSLLARMARFIIADLTDPRSIPKELEAIVPGLAVPVQPLLEGSSRPYAMFKDYWKYEWVLPVYRYEGLEPLLAALAEKVIGPAEGKAKALQERRRLMEEELTKPQ